MLRSVVFKNFVHFRDVQEVQFERGPTFLFGGNSTGKSAILELIRRSMTTSCNAMISNPFNPTKIAFVFCKFDLSTADLHVWSGVLMLKETCFKLVIEIRSSRNMCQVSKYSVQNQKLSCDNVEVCDFELHENEFSLLKTGEEENYLENISKEVDVLYKRIGDSSFRTIKEGDEIPTEKVLKGIEESFVATFSVRSVSPLQWTRSIPQSKAEDTYKEANKRAEIMKALLPRFQKDKIFLETLNYLCYPIEYNVEIVDSQITVNNQPLLKTPVGVIEAIHFCLILACKEFKTICLEEPGTGMHPEMIERMRDILLRTREARVFIIVSHSHAFINNWTVPKINVCSRKRVKNYKGDIDIIHQVRSIRGLSDQILDLDDMKKLLFSFKVIGVEGKRDKIFLDAFFSYIWETINSPNADEKETSKFQKADTVLGNHIICIQSKSAEKNTIDYCNLIDRQCCLMLDRNAHVRVMDDKKRVQKIRLEEEFLSPFSEQYFNFKNFHHRSLNEFLNKPEGFERLSHILKSRNVFVWREGDLEDMIVESLSPAQLQAFKPKEESANKKSKKRGVEILDLTREQLRKLVIAVYEAGPLKRLYDFLSSFENGLK
ncbi:uncharacterized protein LOC134235816 [Saccostrea cucullata]|uniref:uncharacterized protein LOC134235816 n=1 Tax=Saccostrea cuccullata TaxID=36930 RepID=UPI002ED2C7D2